MLHACAAAGKLNQAEVLRDVAHDYPFTILLTGLSDHSLQDQYRALLGGPGSSQL
jgi:hypothetical protein